MNPLQLNPPIQLETPRGSGWAHFMSWASIEHSIYWTVFLETGEIWTCRNEEVRACKNITAERPLTATNTPHQFKSCLNGGPHRYLTVNTSRIEAGGCIDCGAVAPSKAGRQEL